jgi:hypothetical protein
MSAAFVPTENLRFVEREVAVADGTQVTMRILQQWHAMDLPKYMRGAEGEWRDVPTWREPPHAADP